MEVAQGKSMADAAVAAGVEHIIWSSLPNVTEMSNGKLSKVVHVGTFLFTLSSLLIPLWSDEKLIKKLLPIVR